MLDKCAGALKRLVLGDVAMASVVEKRFAAMKCGGARRTVTFVSQKVLLLQQTSRVTTSRTHASARHAYADRRPLTSDTVSTLCGLTFYGCGDFSPEVCVLTICQLNWLATLRHFDLISKPQCQRARQPLL